MLPNHFALIKVLPSTTKIFFDIIKITPGIIKALHNIIEILKAINKIMHVIFDLILAKYFSDNIETCVISLRDNKMLF